MIKRRRRGNKSSATPTWSGGWDVPADFNLARDLVEVRGRNIAARALTYVDPEGIVDRRAFVEIAHDAARWARVLRRRITEPGEVVVIAAGAAPDTVIALVGALKGGLVAAPVGTGLVASELAHRVRVAGAKVVVADRSEEVAIAGMLDALDHPPDVLFLDDAVFELRRQSPTGPTETRTITDRALLLFTAGVADEPKAVAHSHAGVWAVRRAADLWLAADDRDLVWTTARPGTPEWLWHGLLGPWSIGAEIVLHDGVFDPAERLSLLQRLEVTVLCQSPTEYRALAEAGGALPGALPKVRQTVATGEPLDAALVERYLDESGIVIRDGLTQTECALVAATLADMPAMPGVLGIGVPGHDVAVIDAEGHVVAQGEEGELALLGRPPTLFTEYVGQTVPTSAAFRDGWYLTGDRCVRTENDSLSYAGRGDDLIVSGGVRIGPAEVEAAIRSHPVVADVAAVPAPDARLGSAVKAYVTIAPGARPPDDLAAVLAAHVAEVASPHLAPASVEVVESLPHTSGGLVRRGALRRLEEERAATAAAEVAQRQQEAAAAAAAEKARLLAEREAERNLELEAELARADEERQRLLREEEERRREEAESRRAEMLERERLEQEARERKVAERAERERLERERRELERTERETAKRAEGERKSQEKAERDAAAQRLREEREAAKLSEGERRDGERLERERLEREALARLATERAEQERAKEERKHQEKLEREQLERETADRVAAERAEQERVHEERQRTEQAEQERRERERLEQQAAEQERVHEERQRTEQAEQERRERERLEQEAAARAQEERERPGEPAPALTPTGNAAPGETAPEGETSISGLAERIRRYASNEEPSEKRPFGWQRVKDEDKDEDY